MYPEPQDPKDFLEKKETKVMPVLLVSQVRQDKKDSPALWVRKDLKDSQEKKDYQ